MKATDKNTEGESFPLQVVEVIQKNEHEEEQEVRSLYDGIAARPFFNMPS